MVRREIVAAKLASLADVLDQVRKHRQARVEELERSRDARDLVAFNLMLAVQDCADIASHVISDESLPPAPTLADSFRRLQDANILSSETAASLQRAVGLRNVVAHGYAAVDVASLHAASHGGVVDLEQFAQEISAWMNSR